MSNAAHAGQSYNKLKHDADVLWRAKRLFLPATSFSGFINGLTGVHTGAPVFQEISTFGVSGILMDTAADEINTFVLLPYDIDLSKRIYARVHWTTGSVDITDTLTFKVWYKALVLESTAILAIGNTGGVALDTVIAAETVPTATAYTWNVTADGYLDAGKLPETTFALLLSVELDAIAAALGENMLVLGLELRYTPKRLKGPDGMSQEAKAPTFIAGKTYAN